MKPKQCFEVFADGFDGVLLSGANAKILFTSEAPGDGEDEQPEAVLTLTMPVDVLVETCRNVLRLIVEDREHLVNASRERAEGLAALLETLEKANETTERKESSRKG